MNAATFLCYVFGALAVSAAPVVFDKDLLAGKDHKLATVLHGGKTVGDATNFKHLRFLYLVPKLGANLEGGFKSGLTPKVLDFLKVDTNEHVTALLGFSDCKTWYATGLFYYGLAGEGVKFFTGLKGKPVVPVLLDELVDFVHDKTTVELFKGLWDVLPSHVVVHKLRVKFGNLL